MLRCKQCGNEDPKYFWKDGDRIYCRKCVNFGRLDLLQSPPIYAKTMRKVQVQMQLDFPLSKYQIQVVDALNRYLQAGWDVFVYAACGAGKTEIVMKSIEQYLNEGKRVGFAIARRQVVLEICERMQRAFPTLDVIAVCEGHTDVVDGDLIICTMHQLYRYHQAFDLLIMDEVDAFPYRGNMLLETIANHACVGQKVYLSATPDEQAFQMVQDGKMKLVELFQRPHGYPLIVPKVVSAPIWLQYLYLFHFIQTHHRIQKQFLLFVPTIATANFFQTMLSPFYACCDFTSKSTQKETILNAFRKQQLEFLISTTVLERGITIHGIDVVIWGSDHPVFHESSLIQMIGRVGRSMKDPSGSGLFLCKHQTKAIKRCVTALTEMNAQLCI